MSQALQGGRSANLMCAQHEQLVPGLEHQPMH